MEQNGQPLLRAETKGRAKLFHTADGKTVRARTCNDHVLVVAADSPGPEAKLNIEGTDSILIVMPEIPRTPGPVMAFFVPSAVVVEAVRSSHRDWLASNPATNGENRTWAIWFDDDGPVRSRGFAQKWDEYRLQGSANAQVSPGSRSDTLKDGNGSLGDVIAEAKQRIAAAAGVPASAVKITLDLA